MKEITVRLTHIPSEIDCAVVTGAARMTMKPGIEPDDQRFNPAIYDKLLQYDHTSPLEHADLGVFIKGASRVFLAQITRHRICSFTSGSQQYQLHHNFAYLVPEGLAEHEHLLVQYIDIMQRSNELYEKLETALGRDQARYVLPNAARNNLLMKTNLREWLGAIIPQRSCRRNTIETKYIIGKILQGCMKVPHLVPLVDGKTGPACLTTGKCDQGHLCCGDPVKHFEDLLS